MAVVPGLTNVQPEQAAWGLQLLCAGTKSTNDTYHPKQFAYFSHRGSYFILIHFKWVASKCVRPSLNHQTLNTHTHTCMALMAHTVFL